MAEKKREQKMRAISDLDRVITDILVAEKRSNEPFIKTFNYVGENVSKLDLGTLVGVFEVDEKSEDSAYIVNFLASVAKKEYFSNPRRGAIESFEAALHKINVALAELVKHGNIAWLGKFHGALGVFEKNNFHFSVSGEAAILLFRNNSFVEISEGLASPEAQEHPLKTFVEVSSGRLMLGDTLILSSPELQALFSEDSLAKNRERLGIPGFRQFLKTALVNELDMAATLVVDITEKDFSAQEKSSPAKRRAKKEDSPDAASFNPFSQQAFTPKPKERSEEDVFQPHAEPARSEYTDSKTGHIYVQGELPEDIPSHRAFFDELSLRFQGLALVIGKSSSQWGRSLRKTRKQAALSLWVLSRNGKEKTHQLTRKSRRALQKLWRSLEEKRQKKAAPTETYSPETFETLPEEPSFADLDFKAPEKPASLERDLEEPLSDRQETSFRPQAAPFLPKSREHGALQQKLRSFYTQEGSRRPSSVPGESPSLRQALPRGNTFLASLLASAKKTLRKTSLLLRTLPRTLASFDISPLKKWHLALGLVIAISLSAFFLLKDDGLESRNADESNLNPQENSLSQEANGEKNANVLGAPTSLEKGLPEETRLVTLNGQPYAVTRDALIDVRENKSYSPPTGGNAVRFAAAMEDLQLIFLFTENKLVYAWSPISKTFSQNEIALPENSSVGGIGTYLTYLYVLDTSNDQIYRFPRAEGGFGAPTNWFRESVTIEENALFAVNESIIITLTPSEIKGFFQGKTNATFEMPGSEASLAALYTDPDTPEIYGLDSKGKRIIVWDTSGKIIAEYFHEALAGARALSVDPKSKTFFVAGSDGEILSFSLGNGI